MYFSATGEALAEAGTGNLLILVGSLGLFLAAVWARLMRVPLWACILVAVPAALVGGLTLDAGATLIPELSYLLAVPIAAAALISATAQEGRRRFRVGFVRSVVISESCRPRPTPGNKPWQSCPCPSSCSKPSTSVS